LELEESRRAEFLEHSCGNDEVLRHEVESLLAHEEAAEHFMESPALEVMGKLIAREAGIAEGGAKLIGTKARSPPEACTTATHRRRRRITGKPYMIR